MKKLLITTITIGSLFFVSNQVLATENNFDTSNSKIKNSTDITFENSESELQTKIISTKAGHQIALEYYRSTGVIVANNLTTGKKYSCNINTSYVGYGYANGSNEVGGIQALLAATVKNLYVDGIFGPITHSKILEFQKRYSDLANDGIAGPKTFKKAVTVLFG